MWQAVSSNSTGQHPLSCVFWLSQTLNDPFSISFKWLNKKEDKYNNPLPHVPNPSVPHNNWLQTTHAHLFPMGKTFHRRSWVENRFHVGQAGASLQCMWVAWAQHPSLPFRPKGESVSPDSAAAAPLCSQEVEAPDLGPERRAAEKVGRSRGLQRSGEIREGGYSEDHALPWAAHTRTYKHTWGTHTQFSKYSHKA